MDLSKMTSTPELKSLKMLINSFVTVPTYSVQFLPKLAAQHDFWVT
jgi:hypothetical protein